MAKKTAGTYPKKSSIPASWYVRGDGKPPKRGMRWRKGYVLKKTNKRVRGRWVHAKAAAKKTTTTKKAAGASKKYPWVITDARGYKFGTGSSTKAKAQKKLAGYREKYPRRKFSLMKETATKMAKRSGATALVSAPRSRRRKQTYSGYRMAANPYANPYLDHDVQIKPYSRRRKGEPQGTAPSIGVKGFKRAQWYPVRWPPAGQPGSGWISNQAAIMLDAIGEPNFKGLSGRAIGNIMDGKWKIKKDQYFKFVEMAKAGKLKDLAPGVPRLKAIQEGIKAGAAAEAATRYGRDPYFGIGAGEGAVAANPDVMRLLPTSQQLMIAGKNVAVGAVGFAGAIALGKALSNVAFMQEHLGDYSSVVGNLLAGGAMFAVATASGSGELEAMRPTLMMGAGVAALVNVAYQAVARGQLSAETASWVLPASGSVAVAPTETVAPTTNGNGNMAMGQIDVYEAALDGVGAIEDELESELESLGRMGSMGAYEDEGIFDSMGGYLEVPLGAEVEEAAAGLGQYIDSPMGAYESVPMSAEVEEAAAGLGAYLEVPLGAEVEEAAAGFGAYESVPMGQYIDSPMGAMVEEAAAGFGAYESVPMGADETAPEELMPGFHQAIQNMVRKRIASGMPMDQAFYEKLGEAAANLARDKFQARERASRGHRLQVAPRKPPVLRTSAPMYVKPLQDDAVPPGSAEQIPDQGEEPGGLFSRGIF